jgi:uncharacterized LabA/DUF88 family protein
VEPGCERAGLFFLGVRVTQESSKKARVACFIDGFNLYHAVDNMRDDAGNALHHLKWLNLRSLASAFITPTTQSLERIYYFSAYATWLADAYGRHRAYTAALESVGVTLVLGKFKEKHRKCPKCGGQWKGHEEKESDVNFAVELVKQAHLNGFDRALLITADSDLCPAIRLVRESFPSLGLQVLTPPNSYDLAHELRGIAPTVKIKKKHLHQNLFPAEIDMGNGRKILRPTKYEPPPGHF